MNKWLQKSAAWKIAYSVPRLNYNFFSFIRFRYSFFLRLGFFQSIRCSHVQIATFKYHRKVKFFRCRSFQRFQFSLLLWLCGLLHIHSVFHYFFLSLLLATFTVVVVVVVDEFNNFAKTIFTYILLLLLLLLFNPNWLYVNVDFNSIRSFSRLFLPMNIKQNRKKKHTHKFECNVFKLHAAKRKWKKKCWPCDRSTNSRQIEKPKPHAVYFPLNRRWLKWTLKEPHDNILEHE